MMPNTEALAYQVEVYLRDAGDEEDECWVVCAKGDPGAVLFVPADDTIAIPRLSGDQEPNP